MSCCCDASVMNAEERQEHAELLEHLQLAKHNSCELPSGYSVTFLNGSEVFLTAARWVALENRCCSFFSFSLSLLGNGGSLTLRIEGEPEAKVFLAEKLPGIGRLVGIS